MPNNKQYEDELVKDVDWTNSHYISACANGLVYSGSIAFRMHAVLPKKYLITEKAVVTKIPDRIASQQTSKLTIAAKQHLQLFLRRASWL